MTARDIIEPGAIVQIGQSRTLDRGMTWRVLRIDQAAEGKSYARIQSGGSGQIRTEPLDNLRLYRVTEGTA